MCKYKDDRIDFESQRLSKDDYDKPQPIFDSLEKDIFRKNRICD